MNQRKLLFFSIAFIATGVFFSSLVTTTLRAETALSMLLILTGLLQIGMALLDRKSFSNRLWALSGLTSFGLGIVFYGNADTGLPMINVLVALQVFIQGTIRLFVSFCDRRNRSSSFLSASGFFAVFTSLLIILEWPVPNLWSLNTKFCLDQVVFGICMMGILKQSFHNDKELRFLSQ